MAAIDPAQKSLEDLVPGLRPKLHRYCARMAGTSVDGEDIVQDVLLKAAESRPGTEPIRNVEAWLFTIAHNAAIDFIRRRRYHVELTAEEFADETSSADSDVARRESAATSLRTFMRLTPIERSSVILMDVVGYNLAEIGEITGTSVAAVKAALHRGRGRLARIAAEPPGQPVMQLGTEDRKRLEHYIDRFNAHDFDAVRDLLAEDVRLDLVARMSRQGKSGVSNYFTNYAVLENWRLLLGSVDGEPAVLSMPSAPGAEIPNNFILLEWRKDRIVGIRDFYYAPYVLECADIGIIAPDPATVSVG